MAENTRKKHKRRKRRGAGLYTCFAVVVILAAAALALLLFFRVERVEVSGNTRYSSDEIISACGSVGGENLLLLDSGSMSEAVREAFPYIQSVKLTKGYPNRLLIAVTESEPAAVMESGGAYWLISSEGRVLEKVSRLDKDDYLLVTGLGAIEPSEGAMLLLPEGDESKSASLAGLLTALETNDALALVTEIDFSRSYDLRFRYADKYEVVLGEPTDLDYKVRYLLYVVSWLAGEGDARRGTIDLSHEGGEGHFFPE